MGWTSYSDVHKYVSFENCRFGQGTGGYKYAFMRPYGETILTNCNFDAGFEFDSSATNKITFVNCYYDGVLLTAENIGTLVNVPANVTVK